MSNIITVILTTVCVLLVLFFAKLLIQNCLMEQRFNLRDSCEDMGNRRRPSRDQSTALLLPIGARETK